MPPLSSVSPPAPRYEGNGGGGATTTKRRRLRFAKEEIELEKVRENVRSREGVGKCGAAAPSSTSSVMFSMESGRVEGNPREGKEPARPSCGRGALSTSFCNEVAIPGVLEVIDALVITSGVFSSPRVSSSLLSSSSSSSAKSSAHCSPSKDCNATVTCQKQHPPPCGARWRRFPPPLPLLLLLLLPFGV